MAWVKKNLFILIAGVVSLAVLGYAILFVKQRMEADAEVTAQLDDSANKFKDLLNRKWHPGNEKQDNIKEAKEQIQRVRTFTDEMREYIKGAAMPTNLNNREFRGLLDTSLTQLRREAEEAGVTLPNTNYWFTFTTYKTTVDFKGDVSGLAAELEDIKSIMHIIFESRVPSIVSLRRSPVSATDYTGSGDFLSDREVRTNDWAVISGYEVTFQGFSSELARLMEGFANYKQCFIVKSLGVAQAPEERKAAPPVMPVMPMAPMNPYATRGMTDDPRYRMQQIYRPPPPPPTKAPVGSGVKKVLDESQLRFTLLVDSVRLKPRGR
jgi:hypothetical protein